MLGIASKHDPRGAQATGAIKKFVCPISDCESILTQILEDLEVDPWPVGQAERPYRCTGNAVNLAVSLAEAAAPG